MRGIIGKYNRNRKIIWFIVGIIIASISLIHIINYEFKQEHLQMASNNLAVINEQFYDSSYSVISSQKIEESTNKELTNIIKQFINYCNNGDYDKAYEMLSLDCKEVLYPTLEDFKTNYCKYNFSERKTYNMQSWITYDNKNIYLVELTEDMLTTGKVSNIKKQDYYTVIDEDGKYYLNIAGFIEKNNINTSKEVDSVEIEIQSEELFIDYVNLNIRVNNKTKNKILLDSGRKSDTVFVTDSAGIEYISYLFESENYELVVPTKNSKTLKIKFMKVFKEDRDIKTVNFKDIVLNYEKNNPKILDIEIKL